MSLVGCGRCLDEAVTTGSLSAMRKLSSWILWVTLAGAVAGCSPMRPRLYPNDQYNSAGPAAAEAAVDECMRRAEEFVKSGGQTEAKARDAASQTAKGAVFGGAVGAVGGAIGGNAGAGAATGAATGATAGFLNSLFGGVFQPRQPDPTYANFVDRCLREKGYEPIGWQ